MSTYRHWMLLVSVGALGSACQLDLDGRACGASEEGREGACLDGWTCCPGNVCQRECSDSTAPSSNGSAGTSSEANPGDETPSEEPSAEPPPTATAEGTSLELQVIDLPMALPPARQQVSQVYSIGSRDQYFDEFVRIELPATTGEVSHLMLLELDDDWRPVPGARYLSGGRAKGTVAFDTDHGGIFVVVIVNPFVSIELQLGTTPYSYSCAFGQAETFDSGPNGGQGPVLDTASSTAPDSPCPWPKDAPRLWLGALFRGLVGNSGPELGTFDLAAPETVFPIRAEFFTSIGEAVEPGDEIPYQLYDSTSPLDPATVPPANLSYNGFVQSPLASGSVTVSRLTTVANAGYSLDTGEGDPFARLYLIEFANVQLAASAEGVPNDPPFPPSVTVSSATLMYAY